MFHTNWNTRTPQKIMHLTRNNVLQVESLGKRTLAFENGINESCVTEGRFFTLLNKALAGLNIISKCATISAAIINPSAIRYAF